MDLTVLYAFVYLPKAFKQLPFKQLPEYHNCVHGFSNDASYVISGSDDSMIPIFGLWMAKASEQLGVTLPRVYGGCEESLQAPS
ncbi:hypothetical protein HanRHA438_Chr16g0745121 [Helianthus annuus]|nr:hypothetical protein HanHA300_Chr16g0597381 [Helianthus annuus]KAJ0459341.1 hypothetical protein HanHA89_Chr16g0647851 [Helianthus annuus]KAJ0643833.1 hypothetical protein HanOQP8_Chr16g0604971 [Helianthus annuus]KAJ0834568.1 hypothetical protein HanRHA438_Chr16g0745121 [Helianthus annuus]